MAGKKVWLTWLPADEASRNPQPIIRLLAQYGLEVEGRKWVDDLEQMAWLEVGVALQDAAQTDLWLIAGDEQDFLKPTHRYAFSVLTAILREARGEGFPIVCLGLDVLPEAERMPRLLQSLRCVTTKDQGWPAKVVASAFSPKQVAPPAFRLGVRADPLFGQWFEVGPREETWTGVMFGVAADGSITHHAVGPKGQLPERTVLEYPIQGMVAQVGETACAAWSVQNRLGPEDSYYVKVDGSPSKIIFGGHPGIDQAEVFVIDLK